MAATKTKTEPAAEPVEYDFDNWDEAAETKAIEAARPDTRYIIVETKFVGRFVDGTIVEAPLVISMDDIDEMEKSSGSPVDQFKKLLTNIGGEQVAREFSRHDIAETMFLATKFFTILQKRAGASFPE